MLEYPFLEYPKRSLKDTYGKVEPTIPRLSVCKNNTPKCKENNGGLLVKSDIALAM